jgi:hypothetical protein
MNKNFYQLLFLYFFIFNFLFFRYLGSVFAKEIYHLNRSPRALLMGDAYTAISDDEYTLFYNPAALGRHGGLSVHLINPDISVTNVLDELDRFENFPSSDPAAIAERIMGFPLHVHLGATPGLKMGNLGFSLMAQTTTDILLRNLIYPSLDVRYGVDRGWVLGYAYSTGTKIRSNKDKKNKVGNRTNIGFSIKNINRQGIFDRYDLFGLELLTKLSDSNSDINEIKKALGYSTGQGWGADLGFERVISSNTSQFVFAISILDVGDTRFSRKTGTKNLPLQKMSVNTGVSWSQNFKIIDYTLSLDLSPINQGIDYRRTTHFGAEVNIPFIGFLFGYNSGYLSYGVKVDLWVLKLYAGFYGIELGKEFRDEKTERAIVYLSILDFKFDV